MPVRKFLVCCAVFTLGGAMTLAHDSPPNGATSRPYGKTADGQAVEEFTLTAGRYSAKLITYGAAISELIVPDKNGKPTDIVLGFDDMAGWQSKGNPYFGCTTGRVANRIAKGKFKLDGKEYKLAVNNEPNTLHGGVRGFDKVVWQAEPIPGKPAVRFRYVSRDGEEGYPGTLTTTVTYTLSDNGTLAIDYEATTDQATPVNLTNHVYFNLNGAKTGTTILNHPLKLAAAKYTPADATLIPTGEIASVAGTPFDFTSATPIGERIQKIKADPVGYDLNYVLDSGGGKLAPAAWASSPTTGIKLEMQTTEPGVQLYTGNHLDGKIKRKAGVVYPQFGGFCLEAQHYPDSINQPKFPNTVLRPGQTYRQTTTYRFTN